MRLTETNPGNQYLVEEIQLELATKRRLESLGMTEGSKINVMRKKRNGAVIIKIRGTVQERGIYHECRGIAGRIRGKSELRKDYVI